MGVPPVTFDYNLWIQTYPEFTSPGGTTPVTSGQAAIFFAQAELLHANDGSGPVCNATQQLALLNAVTAHLASIFQPPAGQAAASTLVGRISQASEGTVNASMENDYPQGSAQYWQQTKYGAFYWAATKQFRRFRYYPNPRSPVQPPYGGGGGYGGGWGNGSGWIG